MDPGIKSKPGRGDVQLTASGLDDEVARHFCQALAAQQGHAELQFAAQQLQRCFRALLAS